MNVRDLDLGSDHRYKLGVLKDGVTATIHLTSLERASFGGWFSTVVYGTFQLRYTKADGKHWEWREQKVNLGSVDFDTSDADVEAAVRRGIDKMYSTLVRRHERLGAKATPQLLLKDARPVQSALTAMESSGSVLG